MGTHFTANSMQEGGAAAASWAEAAMSATKRVDLENILIYVKQEGRYVRAVVVEIEIEAESQMKRW